MSTDQFMIHNIMIFYAKYSWYIINNK